jgi:hypothetical protein
MGWSGLLGVKNEYSSIVSCNDCAGLLGLKIVILVRELAGGVLHVLYWSWQAVYSATRLSSVAA